MYYFLQRPPIVKIINCSCPLVLLTCVNRVLIARPHRPLCFKKIRTSTTTAFLISNTAFPNLKFQVRLIDLSQSDTPYFTVFKQVMLFCRTQTGAELEFLRTNSQSMISILDSLHHFSFQFTKNGSATMQINSVVYKNGGQPSCKLKQYNTQEKSNIQD